MCSGGHKISDLVQRWVVYGCKTEHSSFSWYCGTIMGPIDSQQGCASNFDSLSDIPCEIKVVPRDNNKKSNYSCNNGSYSNSRHIVFQSKQIHQKYILSIIKTNNQLYNITSGQI